MSSVTCSRPCTVSVKCDTTHMHNELWGWALHCWFSGVLLESHELFSENSKSKTNSSRAQSQNLGGNCSLKEK